MPGRVQHRALRGTRYSVKGEERPASCTWFDAGHTVELLASVEDDKLACTQMDPWQPWQRIRLDHVHTRLLGHAFGADKEVSAVVQLQHC